MISPLLTADVANPDPKEIFRALPPARCGGDYNVVDDDPLKVGDKFFDMLRCESAGCAEKKSFSYDAAALTNAQQGNSA